MRGDLLRGVDRVLPLGRGVQRLLAVLDEVEHHPLEDQMGGRAEVEVVRGAAPVVLRVQVRGPHARVGRSQESL
jgi:hypothetical protein